MIQDRLTAKFQSAKPVARRVTKVKPAAPLKTKAPATDAYTRGRTLRGSFWL